jgi:hypothetical protein
MDSQPTIAHEIGDRMNTIDSKDVGTVDGFDITARLVPDEDTRPDEFECYTAEQLDAWRNDDWSYVGTEITASREGIALGSAYLGGSEYGSLPGIDQFVNPLNGDGDAFVNGYGPGLITQAVTEANATLAKLRA